MDELYYEISAKDVLRASEGKGLGPKLLYSSFDDPCRKAADIKRSALKHAWRTGSVTYQLPLQMVSQNCGELLPKVLKQLWIDGFELSIRKERNGRYRPFICFLVPRKEWMLTLTAVSLIPRNEADYIAPTIPPLP